MRKRLLVPVIVALSIAGALSGIDDAAASRPPITGSGDVQCRVTGKVKYTPPLGATTVATTAIVAAKLTCPDGETGSTATLRGGKLLMQSASTGMSCGDADFPQLSGTIKWMASGGRVVASEATLTGSSSLTRFDFSTPVVTTGSYAGAPLELFARLREPECGRRGIRKVPIAVGALHVGAACQDDVATKSGATLGADGNVWVVVAPACAYASEDHPTGTISYSYPGGSAPHCSGGPAALVDTGMTAALVNPAPFPVPNPGTYWGIATGANVQQLTECGPGSPQTTYSGDAKYLGFTE